MRLTLALALLAFLLGLPLLIAATGIFVLRPPRFRDPDPTPPEALYGRLSVALVDRRIIREVVNGGCTAEPLKWYSNMA